MEWEEFLRKFVRTWRAEYQRLDDQVKEAYLMAYTKYYNFLNPCQIEVIDLVEPHNVVWVITRNTDRKDMEFNVNSGIKNLESFLDLKERQDPTWFMRFEKVIPRFRHAGSVKKRGGSVWGYEENVTYATFFYNLLEKDPVEVAREHVSSHERYLERNLIRKDMKQATDLIKSNVNQITDLKLRSRLAKATRKLDDSLSEIRRIDEHERKIHLMEKEIVGVRRLVGTETFGEWKVLLSEIDKMSTRIDALSDIRDAYDKVLAQQNEFMKQQSEVMKQQSSFIKWVKYATILLPIAVISVPVIEIISVVIRHFLAIP